MPTDQYLEVYVSGLRDNIDVCHVLHVLCVLYRYTPVCVVDLHANRGKKYPIGEDFAHRRSSLGITTY